KPPALPRLGERVAALQLSVERERREPQSPHSLPRGRAEAGRAEGLEQADAVEDHSVVRAPPLAPREDHGGELVAALIVAATRADPVVEGEGIANAEVD